MVRARVWAEETLTTQQPAAGTARQPAWPDISVNGGRAVGVDGGVDTRAPLTVTVTAPGDKSITHRALLSSLITESPVEVRNANPGGAVRALLDPLRLLGFSVRWSGGSLIVEPDAAPEGGEAGESDEPVLDVGGSSAAGRLLIGVLAGKGISAIVDGDAVLRQRPMEWVVEPLRELGARIDYLGAAGRLPVAVRGPVRRSVPITLRVGSAQARSAVLLAAVGAGLPVEIGHPVRSRDHTERLLAALGADLVEDEQRLTYRGGALKALPVIEVPNDPSLAAYPAAAHLLWGDGSTLRLPGVCLNPTRLGFFEVLRKAGAAIRYEDRAVVAGEQIGTIVVECGLDGVGPFAVEDERTFHSLIDEAPLLAAVGTRLPGSSRIGASAELVFKETNRLLTTQEMLRGFGADVTVSDTSIRVEGGAPLTAATVDGFGDHRIAMTAVTLGCALPGRTTVLGGACHTTSYPGFAEDMAAIGADIERDGE